MSDENNVETVGTSLEEAMQSNVQEQAAEHASSVEEAQQEDATPVSYTHLTLPTKRIV